MWGGKRMRTSCHTNCSHGGLLLMSSEVSIIQTEQWRMQSCSTAAPVQNCLSTAQEPSCSPLIHKLLATRTIKSYFNKTGNIVQNT